MPFGERLFELVIIHAVLGGGVAFLARIPLGTAIGLDHLPIVPYIALVLCQASLIALWGGSSNAPLRARLTGLLFGGVYLEVFVPRELSHEFQGVSTVAVAATTLCLLAMRVMGSRVERPTEGDGPARAESEGLKLSIRGIMIFTAVVAVLCAAARALQASPPSRVLLPIIWALCFVAVGLTCFWAALGKGRPIQRAPVVFVLSPLLGAFFAFAAQAHKAGWAYILLIMTLFPATLLGSLWVGRSCGYRFVGRSVGRAVGVPDRNDRRILSACPENAGAMRSARRWFILWADRELTSPPDIREAVPRCVPHSRSTGEPSPKRRWRRRPP